MLSRLKEFYMRHREVVRYIFFGGLTTLVNYLVYFPLYNLFHVSATASTAISWVVAVLFAFVTNKPLVFESKDWSAKTVIPEFIKFVGSRVASGALETAAIWLTVDVLLWNGNLMKILLSVVVVILNYLTSKLFAFRK